MRSLAILIVSLLTGLALPARATLLTFDDLPPSPGTSGQPVTNQYTLLPAGYGGLQWSNVYCLDGQNYSVDSGYKHAVVSPKNVVFDGNGVPASISGAPFDFNSVFLTAVWNDNLQIQVDGYRAGEVVYSRNVVANTAGLQLYSFDYANIDMLQFTPSGGTWHGFPGGEGEQFVMDNISVTPVPEPASLGVLAAVGGSLLLRRRRWA